MKFFEQINEKWRLRDEIRSMVKFSYLNLLDRMDHLGPFDLDILPERARVILTMKPKAACSEISPNVLKKTDWSCWAGAKPRLA